MTQTVDAAGIVVFARTDPPSFLLLRHADRWDLPKGHAEAGESPVATALRETNEETGIATEDIELDDSFRWVVEYDIRSQRHGHCRKRVTYFLGYVPHQCVPQLTEHIGFRWFDWPPAPIQMQTIDPLVDAVKHHFECTG